MKTNNKKLLLVFELNQTLLWAHNRKSKMVDLTLRNININYNDTVDHYDILYRNGKQQLLQYLFRRQKDTIDVAVWSNLNKELTQNFSLKYFGRFYRQLLFVMPCNRALYSKASTQPTQSIKIPKQLNGIYSKFSNYNSGNTLVISSEPNTLFQHSKNDLIIPSFSPKYPAFKQDLGGIIISKYMKGLTITMKQKQLDDIRILKSVRPIQMMFQRYSKRFYTDPSHS